MEKLDLIYDTVVRTDVRVQRLEDTVNKVVVDVACLQEKDKPRSKFRVALGSVLAAIGAATIAYLSS